MRVLVVDDSAFMRRALKTMLQADPSIQVVATGANGEEAVALAEKHKPDVITLDIEMPVMDGLTALRHIMRKCPTNVLMVSSLTTEGSNASLQALRLGAADVLAKDHSTFSLKIVTKLQDRLLESVRALASSTRFKPNTTRPATAAVPTKAFTPRPCDLLLIGSSTGGPPVLEKILADLPPRIRPAVIIAQHMPEIFTRSMTERLDRMTGPPIVHLSDTDPIQAGTIHIAPGGSHLQLVQTPAGRLRASVGLEPRTDLYRPSVSALFESAAATRFANKTLAMVLTGIGDDGLRGARLLTAKGGQVVAQDEASCVVFGMPKAVTNAKLIDAPLNPDQLRDAVHAVCVPAGFASSAA